MTKSAFALGFVIGALYMSIFFDNHTSTFVQAAEFGFSGFEPTVPPLRGLRSTGNLFSNIVVRLDGAECDGCEFGDNVTIRYSGGLFTLKNSVFKTSKINISLEGAALNTFLLLRYLETLNAPTPKVPEEPKWSISVKPGTQMDWTTPIKK